VRRVTASITPLTSDGLPGIIRCVPGRSSVYEVKWKIPDHEEEVP
jgi:hypothetical protein